MQIRVRLFATLRQIAGWAQQSLYVTEGATVAEALTELDRRYPELTVGKRTIYVALNQEYAHGEQVLKEGDELALFPPVSGGSDQHGRSMLSNGDKVAAFMPSRLSVQKHSQEGAKAAMYTRVITSGSMKSTIERSVEQ